MWCASLTIIREIGKMKKFQISVGPFLLRRAAIYYFQVDPRNSRLRCHDAAKSLVLIWAIQLVPSSRNRPPSNRWEARDLFVRRNLFVSRIRRTEINFDPSNFVHSLRESRFRCSGTKYYKTFCTSALCILFFTENIPDL